MKRPNPPPPSSSSRIKKRFRYTASNYNPRSKFPRSLSERPKSASQQSNLNRVSRKPRLTMCKLSLEPSSTPTPPPKPLRLNPRPLPPPLQASPSSDPEPYDPIVTPNFSTQRRPSRPLVTPLPTTTRRLSLDPLTSNPRLHTSQRNSFRSQSHPSSPAIQGSIPQVRRRINLSNLSPHQLSASSPRTPQMHSPIPVLTQYWQEASTPDSDCNNQHNTTQERHRQFSPDLANISAEGKRNIVDTEELIVRRDSPQSSGGDSRGKRVTFGVQIQRSLGLQSIALATPSEVNSNASPPPPSQLVDGPHDEGAAEGSCIERLRESYQKQEYWARNGVYQEDQTGGLEPKQDVHGAKENQSVVNHVQAEIAEGIGAASDTPCKRLMTSNADEASTQEGPDIEGESVIRRGRIPTPPAPPPHDSQNEDVISSGIPVYSGQKIPLLPAEMEPAEELPSGCQTQKQGHGGNADLGHGYNLSPPQNPKRNFSPNLANMYAKEKRGGSKKTQLVSRRDSPQNSGEDSRGRRVSFGVQIQGSLGLQSLAIATPSDVNSNASPPLPRQVVDGPQDEGAAKGARDARDTPCKRLMTGNADEASIQDGIDVEGEPVSRRERMATTPAPPQYDSQNEGVILSGIPARPGQKRPEPPSNMEAVGGTPLCPAKEKGDDCDENEEILHSQINRETASNLQRRTRASNLNSAAAMRAPVSSAAGWARGRMSPDFEQTSKDHTTVPAHGQQGRTSGLHKEGSLAVEPALVATKSDINIRNESSSAKRCNSEEGEQNKRKGKGRAAQNGLTDMEESKSRFAELRKCTSQAVHRQKGAKGGIDDVRVQSGQEEPARTEQDIEPAFSAAEKEAGRAGSRLTRVEPQLLAEQAHSAEGRESPVRHLTQQFDDMGTCRTRGRPRALTPSVFNGQECDAETPEAHSFADPQSLPVSTSEGKGRVTRGGNSSQPGCVTNERSGSRRVYRRVRSPIRMGWISDSESPIPSGRESHEKQRVTQEQKAESSEGIWMELFRTVNKEDQEEASEVGVEGEGNKDRDDLVAAVDGAHDGKSEEGRGKCEQGEREECMAREEERMTEPPSPDGMAKCVGSVRGGARSKKREHEVVGRSRLVWIRSGQLRSPHSPGSSGEE